MRRQCRLFSNFQDQEVLGITTQSKSVLKRDEQTDKHTDTLKVYGLVPYLRLGIQDNLKIKYSADGLKRSINGFAEKPSTVLVPFVAPHTPSPWGHVELVLKDAGIG